MQEKEAKVLSGWTMLPVVILNWLFVLGCFIMAARSNSAWLGMAGVLLLLSAWLLNRGLFMVQPNEARVLVLFGRYAGTVKKDGYHWANPFSVTGSTSFKTSIKDGVSSVSRAPGKFRISLRARNFQPGTLRVNDQRGNPIEIGAVVVWRVADTAKALFDVDAYENYVQIQSETALRHLAAAYPYDHMTDEPKDEFTLRGSGDIISDALLKELEERLAKAGVVVDETRLMHLAYAPEIAGAMLRRQQAEAIIAARKKIVVGAVSMVDMALSLLSEKRVVELDEERKAAMVSNLLVVLCGEKEAEPVINTGTLYQ
jgi:regulator of protease activity HflC (stomatin/prohibitin superfamily)